MSSSRLQEACSLLVQSPPGQTSQVYHDLRGILFDAESNASDKIDDAALQAAAAVALEQYNTEQLITATLEGSKDAVVICQAGQVPSADEAPGVKRYVHPKANKTFLFDHIKRTTSDVKNAPATHKHVQAQRDALEKALDDYVRDRYPDGVSSVFAVSSVPVQDPSALAESLQKAAVEDAKHPASTVTSLEKDDTTTQDGAEEAERQDERAEEESPTEMEQDDAESKKPEQEAPAEDSKPAAEPEEPKEPPKTTYAIHHVGNRFNLSNFWSGRWRASYVLDPEANTLTSTLSVQVHYFENGNVQLNAAKPHTFQLSSGASSDATVLAKEVAKLIASHEDGYQQALNASYDELAERAFKALRRQLPLTRQKVDWDKVLNYKLGDELSRA